MLKNVAGVVVGLLVVGLVVGTLQWFGASFHPLPEGLDVFDPASAEPLAAHMETMPTISWAIAFGSELLGAFLGALAAAWIARDARVVSGIIVGLAVLGSLNNWMTFEHPMWFMAGQLVLYPAVLAGAWAVLASRAAPEGAAGT